MRLTSAIVMVVVICNVMGPWRMSQGQEDVVKVLRSVAVMTSEEGITKIIERQSEVVSVRDGRGWTALHYSAEKGNVTAIKVLVTSRAEINTVDKVNRTPLYVAAQSGSADAVKVLIELGAAIDVPVADFQGETTPLDVAASRGSREICKCLLDAGASILPKKGQPRRTKSAIHWACRGLLASGMGTDRSNRDVIELLVEHGQPWVKSNFYRPLGASPRF